MDQRRGDMGDLGDATQQFTLSAPRGVVPVVSHQAREAHSELRGGVDEPRPRLRSQVDVAVFPLAPVERRLVPNGCIAVVQQSRIGVDEAIISLSYRHRVAETSPLGGKQAADVVGDPLDLAPVVVVTAVSTSAAIRSGCCSA